MRRPAVLSRPAARSRPRTARSGDERPRATGRPPGPGLVRAAAGRAVRAAPSPPPGRLRVAVAVLFALDGFVFGSWAARVPDVSAATGAPNVPGGSATCARLVSAWPTSPNSAT